MGVAFSEICGCDGAPVTSANAEAGAMFYSQEREGTLMDHAMRWKPSKPPAYPLLYIERNVKDGSLDSASTTDGSSILSHNRGGARAMLVMHSKARLPVTMTPSNLDQKKLKAFVDLLRQKGIDVSKWGLSGAKSVEHLFWEAYEQRGCLLTGVGEGSKLKRVTRLVKIKLQAEIFGVEHFLFSRMQFMHDGTTIERRQVPLRKLLWVSHPEPHAEECNPSFYAESCPYTEDWREGCRKALEERLGLSEQWQRQHLEEDVHSHSYRTEDDKVSDGFPGLSTLYCIHEVTFRITDSTAPGVGCIGLPPGQEFATQEGDFNFNNQHDENGLPIGTQLNIWTWDREHKAPFAASPSKQATAAAMSQAASAPAPPKIVKGVPLLALSMQALASMHGRLAKMESKPPSAPLVTLMEGGMKTDWAKAKKMSKNITDPKYSLAQFNKDLSAFPELNLYLLEKDGLDGGVKVHQAAPHHSSGSGLSSGRTIGDEYQRTVGAFFAVYWLLRIPLDGKDGFTFGVDENWKPITQCSADDTRLYPTDKRIKFHKEAKWDFFKKLLTDAGLITDARGKWRINEKRVLSLLALTAIHDIMKMEALLPQVQPQHAPYHGYKAGDVIADHDAALSYLMDHYPRLLPSFADLDPDERRSVQFTQCNICFNHGWFVQAEAPPGAIFTKFKETLKKDQGSKIGARDVALYFVHWITDLAGAEPTPLGGCEKFSVKFPLPVLNSFLRSFEFVEKIAEHSETEVMEEYLKVRWTEHTPSPGPVPTGDCAVARMRLLCMAQMNAAPVLKDFAELDQEDRELLNAEMGRTGCEGQSFSSNLVPKEVFAKREGPAFLIYYGPAFFQNLGNDRAVRKLTVLAELYRCARAMWPASEELVGSTVIVRIDTIKALSTGEMLAALEAGDMWLLVKHNESEAFIERSSKRKLNKFIASSQSIQILDLSAIPGA